VTQPRDRVAQNKLTREAKMSARTDRTITHAREAFLSALMRGLSVTGAAIHANLPRRTIYDWRNADTEFRTAWDDALEYGSDRLEDEAFRRAHDGVEKPLVSGGKLVKDDDGVSLRIREYSDTLMCLLLKSRRPEKYRDRVTNEHVGPEGRPITLEALIMASLKPKEKKTDD
jgi:hypothetical protein